MCWQSLKIKTATKRDVCGLRYTVFPHVSRCVLSFSGYFCNGSAVCFSLLGHQIPVDGTPSSWPLASPSPVALGGRPAAPPRTFPPRAHHARGRDKIHKAASLLKSIQRKAGCSREGFGLFLKTRFVASDLIL